MPGPTLTQSILPQLQVVHNLVESAAEALAVVDDPALKEKLTQAIAAFGVTRTTEAWTVEDVMERAKESFDREVSPDEAWRLLFDMNYFDSTSIHEVEAFDEALRYGLGIEDEDNDQQAPTGG